MTHYKTLIDTEWLGQWDFPSADREVVVVIETVERFASKRKRSKKIDGKTVIEPNKRVAIGFRGKRKKWLAGPVSQAAIAAMYGPHVEGWIGKPIALYVDPNVVFGNTTTGGVRVRPSVPRGAPSGDTLDRPVDVDKAEEIAKAAGREPGEDDV